jgi:hypothetical protein
MKIVRVQVSPAASSGRTKIEFGKRKPEERGRLKKKALKVKEEDSEEKEGERRNGREKI